MAGERWIPNNIDERNGAEMVDVVNRIRYDLNIKKGDVFLKNRTTGKVEGVCTIWPDEGWEERVRFERYENLIVAGRAL